MLNGKKIIVVMPARNTAKTIGMTINAIPRDCVDEIIVVDDKSSDGTSEIAKKLGAKVICHETRKYYGGAQKTGYKEALRLGADVIVMVHADFQYDPTLIPQVAKPVAEGRADACFGSRMAVKSDARKGGMPLWRFAANRGLTALEEFVLQLGISEYHTGYRAFSRRVLTTLPLEENGDDFIFDNQMLVQCMAFGFQIAEVTCPTRYTADSSSIGFRRSCVYGLGVLKAFDFGGKEIWARNIQADYGKFGLNWGYASSPLLKGDALYVPVLHGMKTDDPSYILRI
ncbi:MAG: glycosyltransferase family 2 protein, partial [Patescibacteria group bacterium]